MINLISAYQVLRRLSGVRAEVERDRRNRTNPDGDHCYIAALNALKTAQDCVRAEVDAARERNPGRGSLRDLASTKKLVATALRHLVRTKNYEECRKVLIYIIERPNKLEP